MDFKNKAILVQGEKEFYELMLFLEENNIMWASNQLATEVPYHQIRKDNFVKYVYITISSTNQITYQVEPYMYSQLPRQGSNGDIYHTAVYTVDYILNLDKAYIDWE